MDILNLIQLCKVIDLDKGEFLNKYSNGKIESISKNNNVEEHFISTREELHKMGKSW
jgi:hypothetical protein